MILGDGFWNQARHIEQLDLFPRYSIRSLLVFETRLVGTSHLEVYHLDFARGVPVEVSRRARFPGFGAGVGHGGLSSDKLITTLSCLPVLRSDLRRAATSPRPKRQPNSTTHPTSRRIIPHSLRVGKQNGQHPSTRTLPPRQTLPQHPGTIPPRCRKQRSGRSST